MLYLTEELRKEKGLTQQEVGERVGITQRRYSSYETGARKLPIKIAKKVGEVLEVDWWEFYEDE